MQHSMSMGVSLKPYSSGPLHIGHFNPSVFSKKLLPQYTHLDELRSETLPQYKHRLDLPALTIITLYMPAAPAFFIAFVPLLRDVFTSPRLIPLTLDFFFANPRLNTNKLVMVM